jgi:hypothetical protein
MTACDRESKKQQVTEGGDTVPTKDFFTERNEVNEGVSNLATRRPTVSPYPFVAFVSFCKKYPVGAIGPQFGQLL